MADSLYFNGASTATPSVVTSVQDSAMAPVAAPGATNLVVVGQSTGGLPGVLYTFGSPQAAAKVLLGGELLTAVQAAFGPSNQVGGPAVVYAMRVGSMTPATLTLSDGFAVAAITLTPTTAGYPSLGYKVSIAAGTTAGLKVTLASAGSPAFSIDNLQRQLFTAYYTGAGATPKLGASSFAYTLTVGGTPTSLSTQSFPTVGAMVDAINSQPGWNAVIGATTNASAPSSQVDFVGGSAVAAGGLPIYANTQAVSDFINGPGGGGLFTAVTSSNAYAQPALTNGFVFCVGGGSPAVAVSDWVNALVALQSANVQAIAVLSPLPAVWAAASAHCQYMSGAGMRERRWFSGPAVGTSIAAVEPMPALLNDDRGAICWPGYYGFDAGGNRVLYASYMTAALIAAGFCALSPGQTMTNVSLAIQGVEIQANKPTDTDPLILSGVLVVRGETNGFSVVRAVSTWLSNNNYNRVEISCGYAVDFVCRTIRSYQRVLLGSNGAQGQGVGPLALARAQAAASSALDFCAKPAPSGPGAIVGDANSPPWRNLQCFAQGDQIATQVQLSPVIPLNFLPTTIYLAPYSGVTGALSAAVSATSTVSVS